MQSSRLPLLFLILLCLTLRSDLIRSVALHTSGAAGPSYLDAFAWRRMCTSFREASNKLYNAVALCARRIACDPDYLSSISIISVFNFTSSRIAAIVCMPSLQVESAIHATQKLFRKDETEAVLLVDADNAFNH